MFLFQWRYTSPQIGTQSMAIHCFERQKASKTSYQAHPSKKRTAQQTREVLYGSHLFIPQKGQKK
ncbi:hypothetical protein SQA50_18835 [Pseudomonas sp. 18]|uniref:Uncharacterized protein n=1 Tax=Pseudomonas fragariae (ex Marin et al. 2024) TaxID=3080056 RepID=A0ABU5B7Y8_9PSED|nr:hypothetical protein [Pseudomonas sp. 18]MDX9573507.1 hypothetical protein [Pseudomonas sp. 21(2023)]MDX9587669.1 hypothetical protein [Pseudomonas sp. 19(2023)]MDX9624462.1 hypothetical protein [Pseudomonas sp. 20]MDY6479334.1 hypothetical protein [Pseudomonas sp. 18]